MFYIKIKRDLKIHQFHSKGMILIYLWVLLWGVSQSASAHEMWLEPIRYEIAKGDKVLAHEKVGQNFKGNKYAYLTSSYEQLNITMNGITRSIKPRLGSLPAVQDVINDEGLLVLSAISTPTKLIYEERKIFDKFLKAEGLDWVFEAHKERGLPEIGFTEVYRRYPKSLVKVGNGIGQDVALGLPLEWVAVNNPYQAKDMIKMKLLWKGKPYGDAHVSIFTRTEDQIEIKKVIKSDLITDQNGTISLPVKHGNSYLINAVKMIEPDAKIQHSYDAVWESLWASMTFKVLIKK